MSNNPYRVLICDDDQSFAEMLCEYLKIACGCDVSVVTCEEDLWPVLQKDQFDILFLDYRLPGTNGIDILKKITQEGVGVPTVMMTGQGSETIAARAIQAGALDYLVKGRYEFSSLRGLIERAVHLNALKRVMQESLKKIQYQAMVLNAVRDAVVVWGIDGEITYWNRSAELMYGMDSAAMVGKSVYEVYFPLFHPAYQFPLPFDQGIYQSDRWFQPEGKERIWLSSRVSVLTENEYQDRPVGFMDVTRDITERKLMEVQIQRAHTRLAQATRSASIGQLASSVAHQISNPLTTIIGEAQLLLMRFEQGDSDRELAEAIVDAGWRAQQVINELMKFSSVDDGARQDVPVGRTVEKALLLTSAHIRDAGIDLRLRLPEKNVAVHGNEQQLTDFWVNLLLAIASQAESRGIKTIFIEGQAADGQVVMTCAHDGTPVTVEEAATIFEPQLLPTSAKWGTGMELSICREIVRQHSGEINVRSQLNSTLYEIVFTEQETK